MGLYRVYSEDYTPISIGTTTPELFPGPIGDRMDWIMGDLYQLNPDGTDGKPTSFLIPAMAFLVGLH